MESSDSQQETPARQLVIPMRVEYAESDAVITRFANEMIVKLDESGYYIEFYEARPPFLGATQEQINAAVKNLQAIRAECVSRVFIPKDKMPDFARTINDCMTKRAEADEVLRQTPAGEAG